MSPRRVIATGLALGVVALASVLLPVFPMQANPPNFQCCTTYTVGNRTVTEIADPPTEPAFGSMTFCLLGRGALLYDWSYHPLTTPDLFIVSGYCPAGPLHNPR